MKKTRLDRRQLLKIAGMSLGAGALYRVAPPLAGEPGAEVARRLAKKNGERLDPFSFVQLSDAHVGFSGPQNPTGTLAFERAVEVVDRLRRHRRRRAVSRGVRGELLVRRAGRPRNVHAGSAFPTSNDADPLQGGIHAKGATMFHSKRWMMAGAAAVLLGSGTARATTGPRTVAIDVDESGSQPGLIAANEGEQVRLVFSRNAGSPVAALVLQEHGIMAPLPVGQPVAVTVRSGAGGVGYSVQPLGEAGRAALTDEQELAAGNTGGRG